jgi:predicted small secreted protein
MMKKKAVWAAAALLAAVLAGCNNTDGTEMDLNGGSTDSFTNTPAGSEDPAAGGALDGVDTPSDAADDASTEPGDASGDASDIGTDDTETSDNAAE